jgi:prephenate dehydrogenase
MVEAVGARPFFLDPEEHDTYVAAVTDLPVLLSYALVNAATASASWRDMARFASEEFDAASSLAANDPRTAAAESLANRDALVHWVDRVIGELYSYRNDIGKGGEDLETSLVRAWENRAKWKAGVTSGEKRPEIPSARDTMAGWLFSRRLWDRQKRITDTAKREPWEYPRKD